MNGMGKGLQVIVVLSVFAALHARAADAKKDNHELGDHFKIGDVTLTRQGDGPRKAPQFTLITVYQAYLSSQHPAADAQTLLNSGDLLEVELAMKMGVDGKTIQNGFVDGFHGNCEHYAKRLGNAPAAEDGKGWDVCYLFENQVKKLEDVITNKVKNVSGKDKIFFRFYSDHIEIVIERNSPGAGQAKTESWTIADEKGKPSFARFLPLNWIGAPLKGSPKLPEQLLRVPPPEKAEGPFKDETPIATEPTQGHGA